MTTRGRQPPPETLSALKRLSEMIDLVYFMGYIGRKTHYSRKPHADPWGYTQAMLTERHSPIPLPDIVAVFAGVGCKNEVEASEWVVLHDKFIP